MHSKSAYVQYHTLVANPFCCVNQVNLFFIAYMHHTMQLVDLWNHKPHISPYSAETNVILPGVNNTTVSYSEVPSVNTTMAVNGTEHLSLLLPFLQQLVVSFSLWEWPLRWSCALSHWEYWGRGNRRWTTMHCVLNMETSTLNKLSWNKRWWTTSNHILNTKFIHNKI